MLNKISTSLVRAGVLNYFDIRWGCFIAELTPENDVESFLGAALTSRMTRHGDVCLDLNQTSGKILIAPEGNQGAVACPDLSIWKEKLSQNPGVGQPGDRRPLIMDPGKNRLYLYRYWQYESNLADSITYRIQLKDADINSADLQKILKRRSGPDDHDSTIDWQKVALVAAAYKRFCVVTGGPGTGKTYTAIRILAMLMELYPGQKLRIFMAAPTGKAASKITETLITLKGKIDCDPLIREMIPVEALTIHRMLKPVYGTTEFFYHRGNPLPADVVVVDEASMVDLALMSKLIRAIPLRARTIFLGDKDQLSSVEAGSVLGDICGRDRMKGFSDAFCHRVNRLTGYRLDNGTVIVRERALNDCIIELARNYRFATASGIGELSRRVNSGDADAVADCLAAHQKKDLEWVPFQSSKYFIQTLEKMVLEGYRDYLVAENPSDALARFNRFRILCAIRFGSFGIHAINRTVEDMLAKARLLSTGDVSNSEWYAGRPILVTRNSYELGLFNGDVGLVWPEAGMGKTRLFAYFPGAAGTPRRFSIHDLPACETVYAMTVHKSQGSEFDVVAFILPDTDYPLMTRELIYTGITRAKRRVTVFGDEKVLRRATKRRIERASGLQESLWD